LFLGRSNVTKNTNAFGENVFTGSKNGDRVGLRCGDTRGVGRNVVGGQLLELSQDTANLKTLLKVVVLVGINELDVFTAVEDDGVVLVVGLSVTENGVAGQLDTELGLAHVVFEQFTMTVDESRVQTGLIALVQGGLLVEVGDLEVGVRTEEELGVLAFILVKLGVALHGHTDAELAAGHAFQLTLQLLGVATKHLDNLGVLNAVKQLDGTAVVHKTGDRSVEGLRTKRSPNSGAQSVFGGGRLETDAVEG